jgi:hypothetical protein
MFFKSFDNKIIKLNIDESIITYSNIKQYFKQMLNISFDFKIYKNSIPLINNPNHIIYNSHDVFSISPVLLGGKGGFGSLLKGQQAVKKKTKNNDACRNLEGKRLRHINQEHQIKAYQQVVKDEDLILEEYNNPNNKVEIEYSRPNKKSLITFKENNKNLTNSIVNAYTSFLSTKRNSDKVEVIDNQEDLNSLIFEY